MPRRLPVLIAAIAIACVFVAQASGGPSRGPAGAASTYLRPSVVSPECDSDKQRGAACHVIQRFFRAMISRRFGVACSLLGSALRTETYGQTCTKFLRIGMPEPMPWGILGARRVGARVTVLVLLGQSELDHLRMRRHLAVVGLEHGALRILETRLVA